MKNVLKKIILGVIFFCSHLHGAANADYKIFAIPGQNGLGSNQYYVAQQVGVSPEKILMVDIPTAQETIDLGQDNCIKYLEDCYQNANAKNSDYIIHATSQGTATALNFLAKHPEAQTNLKALILEAPMASGNSAIIHNAHQLAWLPDWIVQSTAPRIAKKFIFPAYDPAGMQVIKSIAKLTNKKILIVLVHSTHDRCLPYQGACALYYGLKENGFENVYFITQQDSDTHVYILKDSSLILSILEKSNIVPAQPWVVNDVDNGNLTVHQPDHAKFKDDYKAIMANEWL
ncbi:hypothetical protein IPF37_04085 [bacterium]|nr:MAG: hypothetical protein IPF37_04085 [bacterium]